jgi:RNA polymerase subunit RPABC4/transcription elongation factor Spt4
MAALLPRIFEIGAAFLIAYVVALWASLIVWTFRDIQSRTNDLLIQTLSTLLVVVFNVLGLVIYFVLRPHETVEEGYQRSLEEETLLQEIEQKEVCPGCHHTIEDDYQVCPYCRTRLRRECPQCTKLLDLDWNVCPYCTRQLGAEVA